MKILIEVLGLQFGKDFESFVVYIELQFGKNTHFFVRIQTYYSRTENIKVRIYFPYLVANSAISGSAFDKLYIWI